MLSKRRSLKTTEASHGTRCIFSIVPTTGKNAITVCSRFDQIDNRGIRSPLQSQATLKPLYIMLNLTHWGRVTHTCVSRLTITGSDNGLSPGRRQAIIWTNAGILLIGPLGTNFSGNLIEILTFSFTKMRLKVSSAKWRPFCLGLNVF